MRCHRPVLGASQVEIDEVMERPAVKQAQHLGNAKQAVTAPTKGAPTALPASSVTPHWSSSPSISMRW